MDQIPAWLGAVGALILIASSLGTAVAVYRTGAQGTSLREAERATERLRGEIGDYMRREAELLGEIKLMDEKAGGCAQRVVVLEDLITKRQGDDEIRSEIAAVRRVDENMMVQLTTILTTLNALSTPKDPQ